MYYSTMTNALYIHGYGSSFKPDSEKMQHLASEFNLSGVDVDYSLGFNDVERRVVEAIERDKIDILIGTSMGGYTAQRIGPKYGLPWVAINPAVEAGVAMAKRGHTDVVPSYNDATFDGAGLVLLDEADEVFDSHKTYHFLPQRLKKNAVIYSGGDHRFQHMEQAVAEIKKFWDRLSLLYGLAF